MRRIRIIATTIVLAGVVYAAAAAAQNRASREAFFRCKDRSGQVQYGDSMPPQCAGLDTEVLNDNGMQVRLIEGDATRQKRLQREVEEAKLRKEKDRRELRDRTLIETYLTVEDIERLRDQRLELLAAQHRVAEQNITNMRERQIRLEAQIARFKPYNEAPNALPLPENLGAEMVSTANSLRVHQESLSKNRKEQVEVRESFASDIRRFKELKGIR